MNSILPPDLGESMSDPTPNAIDIAETLSNLAYLIRIDAENPGLVRSYAELVEERLARLGELLRSSAATV